MRAISIDRSDLAQSAFVSLLTLAALGVLAFVLARWTWIALAPADESVALGVSPATGDTARARTLFGEAAATTASTAPTAVGIRLLGVVAGSGSSTGYAVLQLEGQPILAVREGEDIVPGLRLAEVDSRRVILERAGIRESLDLPSGTTPAPPLTR